MHAVEVAVISERDGRKPEAVAAIVVRELVPA